MMLLLFVESRKSVVCIVENIQKRGMFIYKLSMFSFILDDEEALILYNAMSGLSTACRVSRENALKVKKYFSNLTDWLTR